MGSKRMWYIHPILIVLNFFLSNSQAFNNRSPSEVLALMNLRESLDRDLKYLSSWNVNNSCQYWLGLKCGPEGSVIAIQLSGHQLSGYISPSIGNLTNLRTLYLDSNQLVGPIPDSIGRLSNLFYIFLSNNKLSGQIPDTLGNLSALTQIYLSSNQLSGPIPSSLGNLAALQVLYLDSNHLSGPIPSSLGNLGNLQELGLHYNELSGQIPSSLGNLQYLKALYLDLNQLSGPIPSSFGNLGSLLELHLDNNQLSGSIPSTLGDLGNLEQLYLSFNSLSGSIPTSFGNLGALQSLRISSNQLSGHVPTSLTYLTHLSDLDLSYNRFEGEIILPITKFLYYVDLSRNYFSNIFPDNFDTFYNAPLLTHLDLSRNQFCGDFPPLNTSQISYASFAYNSFNGTLPTHPSNKVNYYGNPSCQLDASFLCQAMDSLSFQSNISSSYDIIAQCKNSSFSNFLEKCPTCNCNINPLTTTIKVYGVRYSDPNSYITDIENIWNGSISVSQIVIRSITAVSSTFLVRLEIYISENDESELFQKQGFVNALRTLQSKDLSFKVQPKPGRYYILQMDDHIHYEVFPSILPHSTPTISNLKDEKIITITTPITAFLILLIILFTIFVAYKIKKQREPEPKTLLQRQLEKKFIQKYSLAEIRAATNNFSEENLLGSGGYGSVYKGTTSNGEELAVKRSKPGVAVLIEDFRREVVTISKVFHSHLVKLLGYCDDENEKIFVYEFVPNGTLKKNLYSSNQDVSMTLTFERRLKIALGVAEGLNYMHSFTKPPIVHRDIKTDNILLDSDFEAKISDFGLAKSISAIESSNTNFTIVAGTIGYIDPDYIKTFTVTTKSDVYSFGVVLLELITGKPPILVTKQKDGETFLKLSLVNWAIPLIDANDIPNLIDPSLNNQHNFTVVTNMLKLASKCVEKKSELRPSMEEVVLVLRKIEQYYKDNTPSINPSTFAKENESLSSRFYFGFGESLKKKN